MPKLAKLAISAGRPVLAFLAILSSQALIYGPWYPLRSRASGFGPLLHWLLSVPRGDGRATRQKTARKANFGNVASTVSCITPAGPEE